MLLPPDSYILLNKIRILCSTVLESDWLKRDNDHCTNGTEGLTKIFRLDTDLVSRVIFGGARKGPKVVGGANNFLS